MLDEKHFPSFISENRNQAANVIDPDSFFPFR